MQKKTSKSFTLYDGGDSNALLRRRVGIVKAIAVELEDAPT